MEAIANVKPQSRSRLRMPMPPNNSSSPEKTPKENTVHPCLSVSMEAEQASKFLNRNHEFVAETRTQAPRVPRTMDQRPTRRSRGRRSYVLSVSMPPSSRWTHGRVFTGQSHGAVTTLVGRARILQMPSPLRCFFLLSYRKRRNVETEMDGETRGGRMPVRSGPATGGEPASERGRRHVTSRHGPWPPGAGVFR